MGRPRSTIYTPWLLSIASLLLGFALVDTFAFHLGTFLVSWGFAIFLFGMAFVNWRWGFVDSVFTSPLASYIWASIVMLAWAVVSGYIAWQSFREGDIYRGRAGVLSGVLALAASGFSLAIILAERLETKRGRRGGRLSEWLLKYRRE